MWFFNYKVNIYYASPLRVLIKARKKLVKVANKPKQMKNKKDSLIKR